MADAGNGGDSVEVVHADGAERAEDAGAVMDAEDAHYAPQEGGEERWVVSREGSPRVVVEADAAAEVEAEDLRYGAMLCLLPQTFVMISGQAQSPQCV